MSEGVIEMCHCGRPLHYTDPLVEAQVRFLIETLGPTVQVRLLNGPIYEVPRHYIALHGLKGADLIALADRYGWQAV